MLLKKSLNNPIALVLATAITAFPLQAEALTFNFQFDETLNNTLTPPIVGTGTFSFDGDPGDGEFVLADLANFDFSFTIGTNTFTTGDLDALEDEVFVLISTNGSNRFVNFDGLAFLNQSSARLSFFADFSPRYSSGSFLGTYEGTTPAPVPEPAAVLGLLSIAGAGFWSKRQKQVK